MQRVLFVDDDVSLAEVLAFAITEQGREVTVSHSVDEAVEALRTLPPFDAVVTDLRMPGRGGIELVREVCQLPEHPPVIVLTAHGSVDAAVEAMKAGAADFLSKPVSRDVLKLALDRVTRGATLERENERLKRQVAELSSQGAILARSKVMLDVLEVVDRVAQTTATVLIRGDSGTGKELVARRLHEQSRRSDKPFVAINCAALPKDLLESELFGHTKGAFTGATAARKGRFVEANGGTFFLDEIGDLDLELQAKLLRVLQDGVVDVVGGGQQEVDVRLVAATHRDLEAMARAGAFRQDLYFRIRVVPIELPRLSVRGSDIGLLFAMFVARAAAGAAMDTPAIAPDLLAALEDRPWPGNVRELENVATRMTVTTVPGAELTTEQLLPHDGRVNLRALQADEATSPVGAQKVTVPEEGLDLAQVERALVVAALSRATGNRSQAARLLGVARHFLLYRIEKFRITDEEVRAIGLDGTAPVLSSSE